MREQDGAEVFDLVEAHPPHGDPLSPRARSAQPQQLETDDRAAGSGARDARRARLQLLPSPRQRGRGSATAAAASRARPPRRRSRSALEQLRAAHITDAQAGVVLRPGARRAGADRAPDRGAAQEHPRPPRAASRAARGARRTTLTPTSIERSALRREVADPVADARAARVQADRRRRDRERPRLLPLHVPRRDARGCTPSSRTARRRTARVRAVPARRRAGSAATATATRTSRPRSPSARSSARRRVAFEHYLARGARAGRRAVAVVALTRRRRPSSRRSRRARPIAATSRDDEPYRRALVGIYARLAATARAAGRRRRHAAAPPPAPARAVRRAGRAGRRSRRHRRPRCRRRRRRWSPTAGCATCARAVDVFGFHLAPARPAPAQRASTSGSSPSCSRAPTRTPRLRRRWRSRSGRRCCCASSRRRGRCCSPHVELRRGDGAASCAMLDDRRARCSARFGERAIPNYVISKTAGAQRRAGGGAAAQGGRACCVPGEEPARAVNIIPLFETIDDLRALRRDHGPAVRARRTTASCSRAAATCRR